MKKKNLTGLTLNKKLVSSLNTKALSVFGGTIGPNPDPDPPLATWQESECISCIDDSPTNVYNCTYPCGGGMPFKPLEGGTF